MTPLSFVIPASGPCDAVAMHDVLARTARLFLRAAAQGGAVPTDEIVRASAPRADYRPMLELR
jgi:hypothetical protein